MSDMIRTLVMRTPGIASQDGDGVKLMRIVGTRELNMLDPFLLLDWFGSDEPDDYIGGFPDHPHRGFETVTYMIEGRSRHRDSAGNEGVIGPGDVQWMTAGRGIIHSEMPEQEEGRLAGFQLWVNLPAARKMTDPAYQEISAGDIPIQIIAGGTIKVIAGTTTGGTTGPGTAISTDPLYLDISLDEGAGYDQPVADSHNAFIYVMSGSVGTGDDRVSAGELGVLSPAGKAVFADAAPETRFLLIAGKRLNEPVARGGPFVMNTKAEILQAFEDFQDNKFVATGKF